jgi:ribosome-associated heat shock protein Hsp15
MTKLRSQDTSKELKRVRLDKWLWAARFYKTRAIAKQAIDGGKVQCDGSRVKPSKEIEVGMQINLRQGSDEKTIIVSDLSEQRRGAPEAQLLYEETSESLAKRQQIAEQRKAQPSHWQSAAKPNKRDRRLIHKFKQRE